MDSAARNRAESQSRHVETSTGAAFKMSRNCDISESYIPDPSTVDGVPTGAASAASTRAAVGKLYDSFVAEAKRHGFTPASAELR